MKRPPLGTPPAYITDEEQLQLRTSRKIAAIKDALLNERRSADGLVADFLETFAASLEDFRLTNGSVVGFDEKVAESIERMLPLRDDFIDFVVMLFRYRDSIDLGPLQTLWERLLAFTFRPEFAQSWTEVDFDNYRFFNYELMLSFITVLLRLGRYSQAAYFIYAVFFFRSDTGIMKQAGIGMFNRYVRSLDEFRNNRLGLRRLTVTADLIKARATHKEVSFEDLRRTDLVLHYVTQLRGDRFGWFPRTSAFGGRGSGIDIFERMISERHFQKVKALFDVDTVDQLRTLVEQCVERSKTDQTPYSGHWDYDIRPVENVIDIQKIATLR